MPNKYKRKSNKGEASIEIYKLAAEEVNLRRKSLRDAAKSYDLNYTTLFRFIKKLKVCDKDKKQLTMGYVQPFVFSTVEESILCEYLITCSAANYGLSTKEARRLAYQLAKQYNKKYPSSWDRDEMAGEVWLKLFMERHMTLSLRTPQATSLARATSFNKANVELFFANYKRLLDMHNFNAADVWNVDETGVTTVQTPNRVIARKGEKQVSAMTSAERGTLVTVALAVNAIGNHLPPMFIFPRKRFQSHFIRDGPICSIGTGNTSGWMQEEDFNTFLKHFNSHVRPSLTDHKVLLILDNHSSHVAVKNIQFCKENGIILLTFPPHCTHKLQPLDRAVFGPLKKAINSSCDSWMRTNPAKTMTIYDIPRIVKISIDIAVTGRNITSGFSASGIWPLNADIFTEQDFLPSQVTDRPIDTKQMTATDKHEDNYNLSEKPQSSSENPDARITSFVDINNISLENNGNAAQPDPIASTSRASVDEATTSAVKVFSPELIRPLPKALPRKRSQNRRKIKSAVLTDTPEKEALEAIETSRKLKNAKRPFFDKEKKIKKGKKKAKSVNKNDDIEKQNDDYFCLCCLESFSNSRSNEKWVQCLECKNWSHEECTKGELQYICQNCLSD